MTIPLASACRAIASGNPFEPQCATETCLEKQPCLLIEMWEVSKFSYTIPESWRDMRDYPYPSNRNILSCIAFALEASAVSGLQMIKTHILRISTILF